MSLLLDLEVIFFRWCKDLVYTKNQSHLYFDILWLIIVSFTLELDNSTLVLTGYEPHAYLTLPSTSSRHRFTERIVLQIYPNCLRQSLDLGNLPFPSPIGSYTSFTSKKVYWSHFTLKSRHTEQQKNSIALLSEFSSDEDQRGHYLLIRSKNQELYWGISGPTSTIRLNCPYTK